MTDIQRLEKEVEDLKTVVKQMAAALKVLTEKDETAKRFVEEIEDIVSQFDSVKTEDDGPPTR